MSIALAGFALVIYSHSLWAATPQESSAVHFLARSTAAAAAGDTSTAIAILESGISDMPNEPRLLAEAAWLYALRASDLTTVFVDRKKAEDYALRAWRLDPRDPTPWGALAWVRFKQHLTDQAWKFIGRARESPGFEEASTEFRAELHYLGARIWKRHVDDYEHLVRAPSDLPVSSPECIGLGLFCVNFSRPELFNEMLAAATSLGEVATAARDRMLREYREAVRLNPGHWRALRELLLALVDAGEPSEYVEVAERAVAVFPDSAAPRLWLGLGLHRVGRSAEAIASFEAGLALLPAELRQAYTDPRLLLTEKDSASADELSPGGREALERLLWAKSDPLHLTAENERWAEHLARVVYADLQFAPETGDLRGSQTPPGRIYVRYGPPDAIWSVQRDRTKEMSMTEVEETLGALEACAKEGRGECESYFIDAMGHTVDKGGGRWVFWNYDPRWPSFVFTRDLEMSNFEFMRDSYSEELAHRMRARLPTLYEPFSERLDIPHQIARFKDDASDRIRVETFAALPLGELAGEGSDSVDVGTFFFDAAYSESYRWQRRLSARARTVDLSFTSVLAPGTYEYSIEAYSPRSKVAALARGQLETSGYSADSLKLSDLLVADRIVELRQVTTSREDLRISGSADLAFHATEPVGLYWETYGLAVRDGLARYRVTLELEGVEERSLPLRVLRGIARAVGSGDEQERPWVEWEREVVLEGRDRSVDWLVLQRVPAGAHRIILTVRDEMSGAAATADRRIEALDDEGGSREEAGR